MISTLFCVNTILEFLNEKIGYFGIKYFKDILHKFAHFIMYINGQAYISLVY